MDGPPRRPDEVPVQIAVDARARLGEGPVWHAAAQQLIWVDIVDHAVHFYDPATGQDRAIEVPDSPGVAMPRTAGGLVLAIGHGFGFLDLAGRYEPIEMLPQTEVTARMNDGNCDSAGRFWAGTMGLGAEPQAGALYRLDPDLTLTRVLSGVTESNGIDWSPDDKLMYYVDSLEHRADVFDFDLASGSIENRRPFVTFEDAEVLPDGLTVDAEGYVWIAFWDGAAVRRYSPGGQLDRIISLPTRHITSCTFGGSGLDQLYITSSREWLEPEVLAREPAAGAVFVCRPGVSGRPQQAFGG